MFCNHCKNSIQDGQLLLVKEIGNIACRYITRKLKIQECIRVLHRAGYPILYGSTLWVSWNFLFFIFVSFIFYDWNKKNCFYKLKLFIEWKLKMKEKKICYRCPMSRFEFTRTVNWQNRRCTNGSWSSIRVSCWI